MTRRWIFAMGFLIYLKMHVICGGPTTNCARMRGNAMVCKMHTRTCSHIRIIPTYNLPFWNVELHDDSFERLIEIIKQFSSNYELGTKFSQPHADFNSFISTVHESVIRAIKYLCKEKIPSKALRHVRPNKWTYTRDARYRK